MSQDREQALREGAKHWLVQPRTIRILWWVFGVILALTVVAQRWVHVHAHFGVDGWPGFYAAYGFLSCVAMVLFAKVLGWWLKRPDDYYIEPTQLAPSALDEDLEEAIKQGKETPGNV
ncbi:hypothetical protein [Wenzhouxiangella marina]|uniref:Uncharacterized protein n=1 Tax=Wenzhouxiangella marina TaxID=1579979 RepID=A0A0K0XT16_9GAMM|nr:hypothetical protein [Wenzhouxiangella marina]AKS40761.1 hypothetical protein WM2015_378 [Wenzhouxiangella marina]MBB6087634.1 hypothetical protein [Wenzhouxiangella marina]